MAMRTCPICQAKLSAGKIAAYSNDLECSNCKAPLETAAGSRDIAALAGLAAAGIAWSLTADSSSMLSWVLPLVYSYLAFSVVSALTLMAFADLRVRMAAPSAAVSHAGGPAEAPTGSHH